MKNFAFIDVFTQKLYGENFGSKAIFGVSEIRENLMNISAMVINDDLNFISLKTNAKDYSEMDLECMMDTEIDLARQDYNFDSKQILLQKDSEDLRLYIDEVLKFIENHKIETLFIYGLPFEKVINLGLELLKPTLKVWIVVDCTKSLDGDEREKIKEYQKKGLKAISFRNLEKYLKI